MLGSYLSYRGTDMLNKKQQLNELKNIAKAIDINFEHFSTSEVKKYAELYTKRRSNEDPKDPKLFVPMDPLYLSTDIYFTFNHDICKFDYKLSSDIYQFYIELFRAEMNRLYINANKMNTKLEVQYLCKFKQKDMEASIIKCGDKISDIQLQLKRIYEKENIGDSISNPESYKSSIYKTT